MFDVEGFRLAASVSVLMFETLKESFLILMARKMVCFACKYQRVFLMLMRCLDSSSPA